ncbi:hypothetical protein [Acidovorax soli]|uniref:Uncharacterized protein n=2 Tax=Acidovorax soli TaxID=592050 RepID=A0A1H4C5P5_9BURK|nr:hypothetical protein [Acidovorax soli]SEA55623.1 hypothetical protein SAMN05421875_11749 [Acidovorax soli]
MKNHTLSGLLAATVCAVAGVLSVPVWAQGRGEASLMRGAVPDTTAQQRYQSAIREAGGGLKVSLEECKAMPPGKERKGCEAEALSRYQQDMADARAMRSNPDKGPVNITGGPIRSTETVTVKP